MVLITSIHLVYTKQHHWAGFTLPNIKKRQADVISYSSAISACEE